MAYNYIDLTNEVLKKINEVNLIQANFDTAIGVYADVKSAINSSIRNINTAEFQWPFNHVTKNLTLTPNQVRYPFEADAQYIDFKTFRIRGSDVFNIKTRKLFPIMYEEYIEKFSDFEYRPASYDKLPNQVFRTPEFAFGIVPAPDQAYVLDYEYYQFPVDLVDWDDVPTIPEMFRYVIFNGAMVEAYLFRGDAEASQLAEQKHEKGIKDMRKILINRYEYGRSTQIIR
jgi:hypothetical protein